MPVEEDEIESKYDIPDIETTGSLKKCTFFPGVLEDFSNYLTYDEIDRFLMQAEFMEKLLACRIMVFGGLRIEEYHRIDYRDVNIEDGSILVRKGRFDKDRHVLLDVSTMSMLRAYAIEHKFRPESKIFAVSTRTLQRYVTEMAQRSMITKIISCHTPRHTFVAWQIEKVFRLRL